MQQTQKLAISGQNSCNIQQRTIISSFIEALTSMFDEIHEVLPKDVFKKGIVITFWIGNQVVIDEISNRSRITILFTNFS